MIPQITKFIVSQLVNDLPLEVKSCGVQLVDAGKLLKLGDEKIRVTCTVVVSGQEQELSKTIDTGALWPTIWGWFRGIF